MTARGYHEVDQLLLDHPVAFCHDCGAPASPRPDVASRSFDAVNGRPVARYYAVCDAAGPERVVRRRWLVLRETGGHRPVLLGTAYLRDTDPPFTYLDRHDLCD